MTEARKAKRVTKRESKAALRAAQVAETLKWRCKYSLITFTVPAEGRVGQREPEQMDFLCDSAEARAIQELLDKVAASGEIVNPEVLTTQVVTLAQLKQWYADVEPQSAAKA
jgi:hypothetical protein